MRKLRCFQCNNPIPLKWLIFSGQWKAHKCKCSQLYVWPWKRQVYFYTSFITGIFLSYYLDAFYGDKLEKYIMDEVNSIVVTRFLLFIITVIFILLFVFLSYFVTPKLYKLKKGTDDIDSYSDDQGCK